MSQRYREHGISSTAALSVTLDLYEIPQSYVEIFVASDGLAVFTISASSDNSNFHTLNTLSIPGLGGENTDGFQNAYRYIKVETVAANDNEIEIVASRG